MSWRSGFTRKPAGTRAGRPGRRCRQTLRDRRAGNDTLFAGLDPHRRHPCKPFARSPCSPPRFALIAGAPAASAQTVLTMSSWVPPTHSLTRDVLVAWSKEVEKATSGRVKFEMLPKHPSAPPGHVRRGARRPRRRLVRDRELHAGAPSAAADGRAARRRRHRRDQLGRVLAHPLEVLPARQRIQGRQAARRVHARPGPDVHGQEAGAPRSPTSPA